MIRKTHTTAIVLIPPHSAWPSVQAIREKYDRRYLRWMPHITLIYPFRPRGDFEEIVSEIASVCRLFPPLTVTLEAIRIFHHPHDSHTFWLDPWPPESIVRLQQALERIVPDCNDQSHHIDGFTPHLTLGQARGSAAKEKRLLKLKQIWTPKTLTFDAVSLISRPPGPRSRFTVAMGIELGNGRIVVPDPNVS